MYELADPLHSLSSGHGGAKNGLGPTVYAKIFVNGIPAKILIDMGSPATIISLEYVMRVMVVEWKKWLHEQWKRATLQRLTPPDVSLKDYGGHPLSIIAQTSQLLSYGNRSICASILAQKGAQD